MLNNNYGYACINMQLAYPKEYVNKNNNRVISHRNMIKKTFFEKGINYASELSLKNCKDLFEIVKWNKKNNFNFFRMSSDLFPWCSEYKLTDLPDYDKIASTLNTIGKYITDNNLNNIIELVSFQKIQNLLDITNQYGIPEEIIIETLEWV